MGHSVVRLVGRILANRLSRLFLFLRRLFRQGPLAHSYMTAGHPPILPVSIQVSALVLITSPCLMVCRVWSVLPGILHLLQASLSPVRSLRRVGVSPGEDWSGDGVHRYSPVSMGDSELAIMSEFSNDTDPDMENELCRLQPLQVPVSPLSTTTSVGVMSSPSPYPASAVPVVPSQSLLSGGLWNRSERCLLLELSTCFRCMNRLRICCTSRRRRR